MRPAISMYAKGRSLRHAEQAEALLYRYIDEAIAGNPKAKLKVQMFNAAIDAYAKIGEPGKAQRILDRMMELSKESNDLRHLKPDTISLASIANAWAKSRLPDASFRAEGILRYMETHGPPPTSTLYNVVLSSLAHCNENDKALRAEALVKRMEDRHQDGHEDCEPTIYTYQSLITVWSRTQLSEAPFAAERVLHSLDDRVQKEGAKHLAPNSHCYAAAIRAWGYSRDTNKAERAYQLLRDMCQRYYVDRQEQCKPNVVVFTGAINACARPTSATERERALELAETIMDELRQSNIRVNFLTYAAMLRVYADSLLPPKRDDYVRRLFEECCAAGQVGQIVLDKLRMVASPELVEELVGTAKGANELPREWKANVKGEHRGTASAE